VLAAAATRTRSIRLGVGITNPYVRHPAMTAVSMMTVHELSGGRAVLGLGVRWQPGARPLGITPVHPLATVRTDCAPSARMVRGERNDGYSPPATAMTAPDLPMYIGSRGPLINRLASRAADGAFVAGLPVSQLAEVVGWARSVRDISIALYVNVAFDAEDVERARPQMVWALVNSSEATLALTGQPRAAFQVATDALAGGRSRACSSSDDRRRAATRPRVGRPTQIATGPGAPRTRPASREYRHLAPAARHTPRLEAAATTFAALRREAGRLRRGLVFEPPARELRWSPRSFPFVIAGTTETYVRAQRRVGFQFAPPGIPPVPPAW